MLNPDRKISRILAVDDEEIILESYRNIIAPDQGDEMFSATEAKAKKIYDEKSDDGPRHIFELVTCRQGDEAVEQAKKALEEERPFSVAFLDVRMPPGPDGVWVAQQLQELDPRIKIVIVTAYTDIPPQKINKVLGQNSHFFYILKPFHWDEIHQFAVALAENWDIAQELQDQYKALELELMEQNYVIHTAQRLSEEELNKKMHLQEELNNKTQQVEEVNTALRVILREREKDRFKIEENVMFNMNEYVLPYLLKFEKTDLTARQKLILTQIEKNLQNITSSFSSKVATKRLNFTPVELQIANLIKHGSTTKDIAETLNLAVQTIESYRKNIRKKMGLTHQKQNLRTHLLEYL